MALLPRCTQQRQCICGIQHRLQRRRHQQRNSLFGQHGNEHDRSDQDSPEQPALRQGGVQLLLLPVRRNFPLPAKTDPHHPSFTRKWHGGQAHRGHYLAVEFRTAGALAYLPHRGGEGWKSFGVFPGKKNSVSDGTEQDYWLQSSKTPSVPLQVWISTNDHFQACSDILDSALFLEVSYMEYNQIGRNSIDKVRTRTRHPIRPLRSQSVELPCAFPFTEKDFIRVSLRSPHAAQDVKSSGALYLSRIFTYKLLVDNGNSYRSGCEGTMTVKLITPPCAHISGKVLLYRDGSSGQGSPASSRVGAAGTASLGFGAEEPTSPPLAFNWLTQGENETEFNCSVFFPGRNKYCFRFVFNFSRSPSPAQTCLVVHRSTGETVKSNARWVKLVKGLTIFLWFRFCRAVGSVAAVEFVQCELWRRCEGAST